MINDFECLCAAGFAGPTCALDVDECASDPCCGRGSIGCTDGADSYACQCGEHPPCPPPPRRTLPKSKRKPALRMVSAPGYGFTGVNCAVDIDECAPNPCLNGGICDGMAQR